MTYHNLWDSCKVVLKVKFILEYIHWKKERSQSSTFHHMKWRKEECSKPKVTERKEIIRIRAEINEIEKRKIEKNSTKPKIVSWKRTTKSTGF